MAQRPCRTSSMSKETDCPTVTCIVHRKSLWGLVLIGDSQLELTQRLVASCIRDNSGVSMPDQIFIQTGCVRSVIKSQQLIHIIKCSLKAEFINIIWRGNSAAEPRGETWAHLNERFAHVCRRRRDARWDKHSWPTLSNSEARFRILNRDTVCWRSSNNIHTVRYVCVRKRAPEEPVCRGAPVGDVVEEDLQLVVIVEVRRDHGADRRRHWKLLGGNILRGRPTWEMTETTHRVWSRKAFLRRRLLSPSGIKCPIRGRKDDQKIKQSKKSHFYLLWFSFVKSQNIYLKILSNGL